MLTPFETLDPVKKVTSTDTHIFFLSNEFSQWHMGLFLQRLIPGGETMIFNCAEQYMMASKAMLFGDEMRLSAIMRAGHPSRQKALGREVAGFDAEVWNAHARPIVRRGNLAKFSQITACRDTLLASGSKVLVEGAHYDPVWGVKLAWDDPRIVAPENWRGTNWLGLTLMEVRDLLTTQVEFLRSDKFDLFAWSEAA